MRPDTVWPFPNRQRDDESNDGRQPHFGWVPRWASIRGSGSHRMASSGHYSACYRTKRAKRVPRSTRTPLHNSMGKPLVRPVRLEEV